MKLSPKIVRWPVGGLVFVALSAAGQPLTDAAGHTRFSKTTDISYGQVDGQELNLDLYLPTDTATHHYWSSCTTVLGDGAKRKIHTIAR